MVLMVLAKTSKSTKLTNKEIYENLKKSLKAIKESCGEICDQTITGEPGEYFDHIKKNVNCQAIFSDPNVDRVSEFEFPPHRIPKWLVPEYNFGGKVQMSNYYRDDTKVDERNAVVANRWTKKVIDWIEGTYFNNTLKGTCILILIRYSSLWYIIQFTLFRALRTENSRRH